MIQLSKLTATFTDLGRKLNEISQILQKLPECAIAVVCRPCNDIVAKVENLERELNAVQNKIVHLVDEYASVSGTQQLSKWPISPSFRGTGISPASKKLAPKYSSSCQLFLPTRKQFTMQHNTHHWHCLWITPQLAGYLISRPPQNHHGSPSHLVLPIQIFQQRRRYVRTSMCCGKHFPQHLCILPTRTGTLPI